MVLTRRRLLASARYRRYYVSQREERKKRKIKKIRNSTLPDGASDKSSQSERESPPSGMQKRPQVPELLTAYELVKGPAPAVAKENL